MKKLFFTSLLAIVFISTMVAQMSLQWASKVNGSASGIDKGNAITLDANGNVYVTGKSDSLGTGSDYLTIKYNSAGGILWARRYNNPSGSNC